MTRLLTIEQAAERLNVSVPTLRLWRTRGYGPQGANIGRRIMYREVDCEAFVEAQFAAAQRGA